MSERLQDQHNPYDLKDGLWKDFISLLQKGQPINRIKNALYGDIVVLTSASVIIHVCFPSPIPQSVSTPPSIRDGDTPPSPSSYRHAMSKSVPHSKEFGGSPTRPAALIPDTCQCLGCRRRAEMEMSRSDTTCQR